MIITTNPPAISPFQTAKVIRVLCVCAATLFSILVAESDRALAAPTVSSVTPAQGAQDVPITSSLIFVFSEDMDTQFGLIPSFPPLVGNVAVGPDGQIPLLSGEWEADQRTLTCQFSDALPPGTTVTWTLNPAGVFIPLKSAQGVAVATTSGSFKTAAGGGGSVGGPMLVSSTPANGAALVPITTSVVFLFDQAMEKNTQLGGFPPAVLGSVSWGGTGLDATKFSYNWSADGTSLTCDYAGDLPGNTTVNWALNPAGSLEQLRLKNEAGEPLPVALYSGSFVTGQGSGGGGDCTPDGIPASWGSYSLSKMASYGQTSAADPVPASQAPFSFGVFVQSPTTGPAATAGSVTLPDNTTRALSAVLSFLIFRDTPATEAALDSAYPSGNYTLRFTQTGAPERVIPMSIPAAAVPVPKVANYVEAQAVNAAQAFTLRWNPFTGATANDQISITVSDSMGKVLFQAPDLCVPRELPVTATSVVIPANTLQANQTYTGMLSFTRMFYASTNAVPEMSGFGGVMRQTEFTIKTGTGGGVAAPARFTSYQLAANGNPELVLTGTAARTYSVQRTGSLGAPDWTTVGSVTMDGTGQGVFQDTQSGKVFPIFYRATAN